MDFVTFDIETTGTSVTHDRIVSVAVASPSRNYHTLVNPGIPIPATATAVHGITDAMVKDKPPFAEIATTLWFSELYGKNVVGFCSNGFDVPLLAEEMCRAGVQFDFADAVWIDAGILYRILQPRGLKEAVWDYLGRKHEEHAHNALADAVATYDVFATMVAKHTELKTNPLDIAKLSSYGRTLADPAGKLAIINGEVCFNTQRLNGVPVLKDVGYARWMMNHNDFPVATKEVLRRALHPER